MTARSSTPAPRILLGAFGWPSGLLEVGSWAAQQGLAEVVVWQLSGRPDDDAPFTAKLLAMRPHVVGFRAEAGMLDAIRGYVNLVREHVEAEIVLGGPTATSHPRDLLERAGADYVFTGEAEEPFAQFLRLAREGRSTDSLPEIPGMAYRHGGRTWVNTLPTDGYGRSVAETDARTPTATARSQRRCLENLVRPVPPAELIAANRLDFTLLDGFRQSVDSLFFTGGRGCPGTCTFCSRLHGSAVRVKGARQLIGEIASADEAVAEGRIQIGRWPLFRWTDAPPTAHREVAWAAVYDEDFFLAKHRAVEFFRLWSESPLQEHYRLSVQTNPCSLLARDGRVDTELLSWIDRLKPMVQLGAESFHPGLLARWHKRHNVSQLEAVLDAFDGTAQDYTVFHLLSDYDSTPDEVLDAAWLLARAGFRHRRMRVASSPLTIPLYDSDTRRMLEFGGRLAPDRTLDFTLFERPHPEWMDPLAAKLADLADAELRYALQPEHRDAALFESLAALDRHLATLPRSPRNEQFRLQSRWALNDVRERRFG
ncbi:MAG: cobalamin-dependent protein [Patescibacteria group bacterium]|nr:cobalamin-dependent protein [Patescibacteria group bacterium]